MDISSLMGSYTPLSLVGIFVQSVFIENFILSNFLGMCSFIACSSRIKTANGMGLAVIFVVTVSGIFNWFAHRFFTAPGALSWLSTFGIDASFIDLSFLELLIFITIIAAFTQITEVIVENTSPRLHRSLGIYLPLIAVNCAVLGVSLFAILREYPFIPSVIYIFGSSVGWWVAIILMAAIREKVRYSDPPKGFEGAALTFMIAGLMSLGFLGFAGINLLRS